MKTTAVFAVLVIVPVLSACAASLVYDPDRSRKQQDCYKITDPTERQRCLQSTAVPHDEYRRTLAR